MSTIQRRLKRLTDGARNSPFYWRECLHLDIDAKRRILSEESAILSFTEEMLKRMEEQKMTRSVLARKLKVEAPYVTKILRGENNFSVKTMAKIARALKCRVKIALIPKARLL